MQFFAIALLAGSLAVGCTPQAERKALGSATPMSTVVASPDSLRFKTRCQTVDSAGRCTLWALSLVELIARPELYHGQRVQVIGFVNFEFEGNGLYLSQTDWERGISRNGLWIEEPNWFASDSAPSRRRPNRCYVLVEGTFDAEHNGHLGMWSGTVERVTRLEPWGPCEPATDRSR